MADASPTTIQGNTGEWEIIVGLEVHSQVISEAKLFSGAATAFGAEPNAQVSPVDAGMPGMLPVINEYCIEQAVRTPEYGAPLVVLGAPLTVDADSFKTVDGDLEGSLRLICDKVHGYGDVPVGDQEQRAKSKE